MNFRPGEEGDDDGRESLFMSENWWRIRAEEENRQRIDEEFERKSLIGGESMEHLNRRDDGLKKNYLNERNSCFTQLCLLNNYFTPVYLQ